MLRARPHITTIAARCRSELTCYLQRDWAKATAIDKMTYLAVSIFLIWLSLLYYLAGQSRKEMRLAIDNCTPDSNPSDFRRFGFRRLARNVNPARLNEVGRVHRERAARTEKIMFLMIDLFFFVGLGLLIGLSHIK